jgi:ABC-type branched-subunit amino acid transport system substrate-binding protein
VQAAQKDATIVGVMGWPYSAHSVNVVPIFTQAKIPMVSQTASSDDLTGISSYFFRVAPTNLMEAKVGAQYAKTKLGAQKAVVFEDPSDSYSQSLGADFTRAFTDSSIGGQVVQQLTYTRGNAQSVTAALQKIGQGTAPDLIYFSGYPDDMNTILSELPKYTSLASTRLLGGDALYGGGYDQRGQASFNRLRFTAFAYPDEWSILGLASQKPAFFQDYINDFSATNPQGSYGFTRTNNNVMLAYDATLALLTGAKDSASGAKALTPEKLQQGLQQINGSKALQGVSGQISFGPQGDPLNKAVVVLAIDPNGHIQMEPQLGAGKFLP